MGIEKKHGNGQIDDSREDGHRQGPEGKGVVEVESCHDVTAGGGRSREQELEECSTVGLRIPWQDDGVLRANARFGRALSLSTGAPGRSCEGAKHEAIQGLERGWRGWCLLRITPKQKSEFGAWQVR